jgi:SAM-dependent methyltransferase
MNKARKQIVDLPFSQKYDRQHAEAYQAKHRDGLARRLSNWREIQVARKALQLADQPGIVLDLPCGAGRFWPMLKEKKSRVVIAADYSAAMLDVAREANPWYSEQNISCLQTSVFAINLPDSAVDSILCMRLLHHIESAEDRGAMLRELLRVTRDTVIISMWVDGNYKAWRRAKMEKFRELKGKKGSQNRFVVSRDRIEREFTNVGFDIVAHLDFLPLYQMWSTYILRKR